MTKAREIPAWAQEACESIHETLNDVFEDRGAREAFSVLATVISAFLIDVCDGDRAATADAAALIKGAVDATLTASCLPYNVPDLPDAPDWVRAGIELLSGVLVPIRMAHGVQGAAHITVSTVVGFLFDGKNAQLEDVEAIIDHMHTVMRRDAKALDKRKKQERSKLSSGDKE